MNESPQEIPLPENPPPNKQMNGCLFTLMIVIAIPIVGLLLLFAICSQ